jgi:hypothetical protein
MDPTAKAEKERFRKYSPEVGLLLCAVWDPIGAGVPIDEYESYVPIVWHLRSKNAEVEAIAAQLDEIADERMGVGRGRGQAAAECLSRWWYWRFDFPAEFEASS